jgi:hypothetical protein
MPFKSIGKLCVGAEDAATGDGLGFGACAKPGELDATSSDSTAMDDNRRVFMRFQDCSNNVAVPCSEFILSATSIKHKPHCDKPSKSTSIKVLWQCEINPTISCFKVL